MPNPDSPTTCTTVRDCDVTATHEIMADSKIRGLPRRSTDQPIHLLACETHLPIATDYVRNRENRSIVKLATAQPTLFDN